LYISCDNISKLIKLETNTKNRELAKNRITIFLFFSPGLQKVHFSINHLLDDPDRIQLINTGEFGQEKPSDLLK
jgi:hypothetical protein